MAQTVAARLSEAFRYSAVFYWEGVNDIAENLTDEEGRNIDTFDVLDNQSTTCRTSHRAHNSVASEKQQSF